MHMKMSDSPRKISGRESYLRSDVRPDTYLKISGQIVVNKNSNFLSLSYSISCCQNLNLKLITALLEKVRK
jgi:hypothetical protein